MKIRSWLKVVMGGVVLSSCSEPAPEVPPRQLTESPFHYPEDLWDAGIEGETLLEIHVSEAGAVDSANVEESSGYPAFDSAAVDGALVLRFDPARRGGDSVAVRVLLPVQFHLPDTDSAEASPPPPDGGP